MQHKYEHATGMYELQLNSQVTPQLVDDLQVKTTLPLLQVLVT